MNNLRCPRCGLSHSKRNGHTHYRKQNYRCKGCGRQFVRDSQRVDEAARALVKRLLLERLSLRGICRVAGVSLTWLLHFIATLYAQLPDDLYVATNSPDRRVRLLRLEAEVDELYGALSGAVLTSGGSGWPSTKRAARSSPSLSATAAASQRASSGDASRPRTASEPPSTATTGRRTRASSLRSGIRSAARSPD
jgi:hypothetical protein